MKNLFKSALCTMFFKTNTCPYKLNSIPDKTLYYPQFKNIFLIKMAQSATNIVLFTIKLSESNLKSKGT